MMTITTRIRHLLLLLFLGAMHALSAAQDTGYADELKDFGVAPTDYPRTQGYGSPTPTSIPGAKVVSTQELVEMRKADPKPVIFVAYGAQGVIPGAIVAEGSGEGRLLGSDLEKFTNLLAKHTNGDKSRAVVFYCHGPKCWLSYNAALHAKAAGYTNVYWYRGGRDAWKAAGKKFKKPQEEAGGDD